MSMAAMVAMRLLKTMNAREGIKTSQQSNTNYRLPKLLKTMNAREGIKTYVVGIYSQKLSCC